MTRTYAREEIKWDLNELRALAALEPPQATFFEAADRWVVKQDGASFAVRPEQIVTLSGEADLGITGLMAAEGYGDSSFDDNAAEAALAAAELADPFRELNANRVRARALVEEVYTLRHGIAENRDGEFDQEERALVEQILQDESGEVTVALREEIAEALYRDQEARTGVYVPAPAPRQQHWAFSSEADDLLARFTK